MSDERTRLEELLPFAVNGTLDEAERAELEAALEGDAELAAEMRFLEGVRDRVRAREVPNSPGEFGLARLKRAIAEEAPSAAPAAANDNVVPLTRRTGFWKAAAVAACTLFAIQTAVVITAPEDVVRLAGGGPAEPKKGPTLTVAFLPTATEADIRALLLEAGVEIVEGPSALGLYRVAPLDADALDAAEAALSGAGAVVEDVTRD